MSKHTKAPWTKQTKNLVSGANGCLIARIPNCNQSADIDSDEQQDATARLIASAPELLEACKQALNAMHDPDPTNAQEETLAELLENAIAKAEGRAE